MLAYIVVIVAIVSRDTRANFPLQKVLRPHSRQQKVQMERLADHTIHSQRTLNGPRIYMLICGSIG